MSWSKNVNGFTQISTTVGTKELPIMRGFLDVAALTFWSENPRLYSLLDVTSEQPNQETIEKQLLALDHVKTLKRDIHANGGLMDPVLVRDKSWEVLEGNCRLAAYKDLRRKDPIKWAKIKCDVLPEEVDDAEIFSIIGQFHIRGKKDWDPYGKAGFLYRQTEFGVSTAKLAAQVGLTKPAVDKDIEVYLLMRKFDRDPNRWSYWYELYTNKKVRDAIELSDDEDKIYKSFYKQVKNTLIGKNAGEFRDMLRIVSRHPKHLKKFLGGNSNLTDLYNTLKGGGQTDKFPKTLKRFEDWLKSPTILGDMRKHVRNNQGAAKNTETKLNKIGRKIKNLKVNLEKIIQEE